MTKQDWFSSDDRTKQQLADLKAAREGVWKAFAWKDSPDGSDYWVRVYEKLSEMEKQLRAYVERPKTKTVERWHVEWVHKWSDGALEPEVTVHATKTVADVVADRLREHPHNKGQWACIRVTGPHMHEVPA